MEEWLISAVRAKKPKKLPVVLTREEVRSILTHLQGPKWIAGMLMYGAGLRLMECLRLRVKDIDFSYRQITVREGKGKKDRITVLPTALEMKLSQHLINTKKQHEQDLQAGRGYVKLPGALERKYPNADRQWAWQ